MGCFETGNKFSKFNKTNVENTSLCLLGCLDGADVRLPPGANGAVLVSPREMVPSSPRPCVLIA